MIHLEWAGNLHWSSMQRAPHILIIKPQRQFPAQYCVGTCWSAFNPNSA